MTPPLLKIENLTAGYGPLEVLHQISLSITQGEIVTIIGANGAGKSSTLLALSGLIKTTGGEIIFNQLDLKNIPAAKRVGLGLVQVPEGRKIFSRLSVRENLELGAYLRTNRQEIEVDLERGYGPFPILKERHSQLAGTLSGGEQQMLAIARALMSKPLLLLLDEPSMGVAPLLTEKIYQTLQKLNQAGLTMVIVEQNAQLALEVAKRTYVMETGKIILEGASGSLKDNELVRQAYLGA